ncbi:MAG: diol dehydratase small subunit [Chloroflexi bacterium]|nr:diol dehydratase small subunit [Chloroflexota bacterium]MCL5274020.1 diol dehydratase small subunit [Chloroflexota bacterium]
MTSPQYPLGESAYSTIQSASGRKLADINMEAVSVGSLSSADLQIKAETLRAQADVARHAGYAQLAENLIRAAELTVVPNEELLRMYETLRPGRATYAEMIAMAERLEQTYTAPECAKMVREAAQVYLSRGLVRKNDVAA